MIKMLKTIMEYNCNMLEHLDNIHRHQKSRKVSKGNGRGQKIASTENKDDL